METASSRWDRNRNTMDGSRAGRAEWGAGFLAGGRSDSKTSLDSARETRERLNGLEQVLGWLKMVGAMMEGKIQYSNTQTKPRPG